MDNEGYYSIIIIFNPVIRQHQYLWSASISSLGQHSRATLTYLDWKLFFPYMACPLQGPLGPPYK